MDQHAAPTRLLAIPIIAFGLLLGAGSASAYQEGTPTAPVDTPVPPEVVETPEPAPIEEPLAPAITPEPAAEGDAVTAISGRAGGEPAAEVDGSITAAAGPEPPVEEGASVNAVAEPQPPTDGSEAPQPLPRGKISPRSIQGATGAAPPPPASASVPAPAPNPAPAPASASASASALSVASADAAVFLPAGPTVIGGLSETVVGETGRRPQTAVPAASRPAAIALPSTGVGESEQGTRLGTIALGWAVGLMALGLAAGRGRHRA